MSDGMRYDIQAFLKDAPNKGQVVLLLGTAQDGPVNSPMKLTSPAQFQASFGDPTIGDLGKAFQEIYDTNKNLDINVMRITGSYATGSIYTFSADLSNTQETFSFTSVGGGEKYNSINIKFDTILDSQNVSKNAMIVTTIDSTQQPLELWYYYVDNYEIVNDLINQINTDGRRGRMPFTCTSPIPYSRLEDLWPSLQGMSITLQGGDDGLTPTKNERFLALEQAYDLLCGYYIDVLVPIGAFFDDTHPAAFYGVDPYGTNVYASGRDYLSLTDTMTNRAVTFHEQLIDFCRTQMGFGIFTHGILGMNPVESISFVTDHPFSYTERLVNACGFKTRYGLTDFAAGEYFDKGYYITIVGGDGIFYEGTDQEYISSGYCVYAGTLASISTATSTTNQPVTNPNFSLRYEFERDELTDLSDLGITTFRKSVKRGIVVTNGVTAGLLTSDMHYISNVRMIQLTMSVLDDLTDRYIGQMMQPIITHRELETAIGQTLSYLASPSVGILKGYDFTLSWDIQSGKGAIALHLMPRYAFEYTSANVSFKSKEA